MSAAMNRDRAAGLLRELARTGRVREALAACKISSETAYKWRRADPDFAAAWEETLAEANRRYRGPQLTPEQQELVRRHYPLVIRLTRSYLADRPHMARHADLIRSAAHMATCRAAMDYRPGPQSFGSWARCKFRGEVAAIYEHLRPAGYKSRSRDPAYPRTFLFSDRGRLCLEPIGRREYSRVKGGGWRRQSDPSWPPWD
jgi:hypothetical protein